VRPKRRQERLLRVQEELLGGNCRRSLRKGQPFDQIYRAVWRRDNLERSLGIEDRSKIYWWRRDCLERRTREELHPLCGPIPPHLDGNKPILLAGVERATSSSLDRKASSSEAGSEEESGPSGSPDAGFSSNLGGLVASSSICVAICDVAMPDVHCRHMPV
jgi:hypothetical protein